MISNEAQFYHYLKTMLLHFQSTFILSDFSILQSVLAISLWLIIQHKRQDLW